MLKRICVFGASITYGSCDYEGGGWVTRLNKYVKINNYDISIYNLGISGDSSKEILKRLENEIIARIPNKNLPNAIIFSFGNNDSRYNNITKDSVETPLDEFKKNIREIIKIAKKYSKDILFIGVTPCNENLTTPTIWNNTEYFTNDSISKYNKATKEICRLESVPFLEQLNEWLKKDYKELLDKEDGLHPNSVGHKKIFQRVKDFLIDNKII